MVSGHRVFEQEYCTKLYVHDTQLLTRARVHGHTSAVPYYVRGIQYYFIAKKNVYNIRRSENDATQ